MIAAADVHYREDKAVGVIVLFTEWESESIHSFEKIEFTGKYSEYIPGEFYKRELPILLSLHEKIKDAALEAFIVDGYVYLGLEEKPGLGYYVYQKLGGSIPVIGAAKSRFKDNSENCRELYRGKSTKPMYITSVGISSEDALGKMQKMKGKFRIPDILSRLDRMTKEF
ncbi:MAG TPA: endonuclease V [Leptospiraceae bacterium]|nr:endonuclease V [Leptospiraceae bacterium]